MHPANLPVDPCDQGRALVLVVDDNVNNLLLMGEVLDGSYTVRLARSGVQALEEAAREPQPALILLDVMMPGMDGFEVIERLRANGQTAGIPVIFVTAKETYEDEEQGLRLGAVDYVTKPINPAVLLARVHTHLALKQARDALTAHNAVLEAEVARRVRDIQLVQEVTVRALASLGETRDNETGMHIRRTQAYIDVLGRHLMDHPRFSEQLAGPRLALIVNAAPLHDIGKIGIRDAVLLKPGRLTPEEFAEMRGHARVGVEAIDRALAEVASEHGVDVSALLASGGGADLPGSGPLDFLWVAREIVAGHHEKWDGSGYPFGRAGDAIPVAARLMALADVFDALISRRVYKAPMRMEQVEQIIADGRGRHFDPAVVDAFFACKADFLAIAERYADPEAEVA